MSINELLGPTHNFAMRTFCLAYPLMCAAIDSMGKAPDTPYNNSDRVAIVSARPGSCASVRQVMHYLQIIKTKEFKQYDWGSNKENKKRYGKDKPPTLDLGKIPAKVPVAMIVGKQDDLADPVGTQWARERIANVVHYDVIDGMDHFSFNVGKDMHFIDDILKLLDQHNPLPSAETSIPQGLSLF